LAFFIQQNDARIDPDGALTLAYSYTLARGEGDSLDPGA
jgi:hypothetical protein